MFELKEPEEIRDKAIKWVAQDREVTSVKTSQLNQPVKIMSVEELSLPSSQIV